MRVRKGTLLSQGILFGVVRALGLFWFCCVRVCNSTIPPLMTKKGNREITVGESQWKSLSTNGLGQHCRNKANVLSSLKHVSVCFFVYKERDIYCH